MNRANIWIVGVSLLLAAAPAGGGSVPNGFIFAAGGDMIGPYHTLQDIDDAPFFKGVVPLFQQANVGFANQEGSVFDLRGFQGSPAAENGGGIPLSPAVVARNLKAMGITIVSKANNHATDYGTEGLVATMRSLKAAGITYAGAGYSDKEAYAPGYLDSGKGKVALVDTASTFLPMSVAGPAQDRRGEMTHPRPGISVLHVQQIRLISAEQLTALRQIVGNSGRGRGESRADEVRVGNQVFRAGDTPGAIWEMNRSDQSAIIAGVKEARQNADFVAFSIHAHETASGNGEDPQPAGFEPMLFHAAIDAGADVVVRNGPHVLNGIEIYKGKPIFYSLGSLFFDFQGQSSYGGVVFSDAWYETVVPVVTYENGKVAEIKLYPIVIESSAAPTCGAPHPAAPDRAKRILEHLRAMSAVFGTDIKMENNIGIIRPEP
jgi:poly-gamma-glutamate synthesis protein (capsule biosynthesis protein)